MKCNRSPDPLDNDDYDLVSMVSLYDGLHDSQPNKQLPTML